MDANTERIATAALVCGLVSIFVFPLAFGGAAIFMALLAMNRVEDRESRSYQNARIGLIAGIVGIVLWVVTLFTLGYLGLDAGSLLGAPTQPSSAF